jgi:hypothetical protein
VEERVQIAAKDSDAVADPEVRKGSGANPVSERIDADLSFLLGLFQR